MAKRQQYDETAREFVYGFYARVYARDKALPEIRKVYSGFAARTWDRWVEEHSWRERRALADAKIARFEEFAANAWIELTVTEGRNHLVKRMCAAIGHPVLKLIRVQIGGLSATGLDDGEFRPMTPSEVYELLVAAGASDV